MRISVTRGLGGVGIEPLEQHTLLLAIRYWFGLCLEMPRAWWPLNSAHAGVDDAHFPPEVYFQAQIYRYVLF